MAIIAQSEHLVRDHVHSGRPMLQYQSPGVTSEKQTRGFPLAKNHW